MNRYIVHKGSKLNQEDQWEAEYKVKTGRKYQDPINKWMKGRIDNLGKEKLQLINKIFNLSN